MFPEYKREYFSSNLIPDGWQDRGETGRRVTNEQGAWRFVEYRAHDFCGKVLHVGRENGSAFMFCPLCLVKTKELQGENHV